MPMLGGTGETKPATPEVQQLCDQLKPGLEQEHGKTYNTFTAVNYKTQVVAGTNYFIKVHVGDGDYLHLRVFKPLACAGEPVSLHSSQTSKAEHDELDYF